MRSRQLWTYNLKEKDLGVLSGAQFSWDPVCTIPPAGLVVTLSME